MSANKRALIAALALIALPAMLAAMEAISWHVHNRNNGEMVSSGEKREYLLHVPTGLDPARPVPLLISMHGAGMWPVAQKEISRWNDVADENAFIVVYPSGSKGDGPRIWRSHGGAGIMLDVQFISDLIDRISATYNIDRSRIYADGLSNGGGMAFALSCTLSDRIAAVGLVASAQLLPWEWCTDSRPVPMIAVHGTSDPVTPYLGGRTWVALKTFPAIPQWTANWARRNRCATKPVESGVATDVIVTEYKDCAEDATAALYTIVGGGHAWPGGGPLPEWLVGTTSQGIDASRVMWRFFSAHPKRKE
jgi:polyhydroxybutyrate depolymerase